MVQTDLEMIIDAHLLHRNAADLVCREQLLTSIRDWAASLND